jgi:hypothetical protein
LQPPAPAALPRCHHRSFFLPSSPLLPASTVHVACEQWRTIVHVGPARMVRLGWAQPKIKTFPFKYCNFFFFSCFFTKFCLISVHILHRKNTKSGIKMLGFRQNFQNTKENWKKEKYFCVYGQVSQS